MRLDVSFGGLDAHRQKMGAPLRRWEAKIGLEPIVDLTYIPHEREIADLSVLQVGDGDTILHDGHRVFLYIRVFNVSADTFEEACSEPDSLRKFHIVWCRTLEQMKAEGRFERYVASDRVDEPFGVALRTRTGAWACGDTELYVCQNCLNHTNWEGFKETTRKRKAEIVRGFSRRRFLETEHTRFAELPPATDKAPPAMGYAADWADRSRAYRESVSYRCEDCSVDCSYNRSLLDTHHQNGVTTDNRISNLRALCKTCHAQRHPNWYQVSVGHLNALAELRAEQRAAGIDRG